MPRTNIVLDDDLIQEGMELSGSRTRRELVDRALRAYIQWLRRLRLRALKGTVEYDKDYDHRKLRPRGTGRS